jgi:hypothetical protein
VFCGLFIFVLIAQRELRALKADEVKRIPGRIVFVDDMERSFKLDFSLRMFVQVLLDEKDQQYCPGKYWISNNYEFEALLQQNCLSDNLQKKKLYIKLNFERNKPSGWIAPDPEKPLPWIEYLIEKNVYDNMNIKVRVPSIPTGENRRQNMEYAKSVFKIAPEESLAYFSESIRGAQANPLGTSSKGDIDVRLSYIKAAEKYYYENSRPDLIYKLFENEDFFKYEIDNKPKYDLYMLRGKAAVNADHVVEGMSDFYKAQKIIPTSVEPIANSYEVIVARGIDTKTNLTKIGVGSNALLQDILNKFRQIYNAWSTTGKPGLADQEIGLSSEAMKFVGENAKVKKDKK